MQKDEPTREWGAEPGPASGGHLASEPAQGESWFEILNAPLPSEIEQEAEEPPSAPRPRRKGRSRTDDIPATRRTTPVPGTRRSAATRRRVRRTVRRVDPLGVLKISVVVYALMLGLWLLVVAVIYNFLSGLGLFDTINNAAEGLAAGEVEITLGLVEKWAFIVGLIVVIAGSIINVIVALLYNLIANLIGGIEVTFTERDQ